MEPNNSGKKTTTATSKMPNGPPKWLSYALLLVALIIVVIIVIAPPVTQPSYSGSAKEPTSGEVLSRLAKAGVMALGEPTVTKLAGVGELKKTMPVIYGNAKDGQYEVRWPTLLVIYDYENDSVVNSLSITPVRLPG